MGRTAKELIAIAVSQIGYREKLTCANLDSNTANAGSGNHTKYARDLHNLNPFHFFHDNYFLFII